MVTEFDAIYYDGKTSARMAVHARTAGSVLLISGANVNLEVPFAEISVDAGISGVRRTLSLPGGAQLQTDDHAAVDTLFPHVNRLERGVHKLERYWGYAFGAVLVVTLFSWWGLTYGLPTTAKFVARVMPARIETLIGEQTLHAIDKSFCNPSALDAARQNRLRQDLAMVTAGLNDHYTYQLELRRCRGAGPNAFALPGGTIVMTDALAKLAENDQQITAVLAHEVGHVRHQHGLRLALQGAGGAALITALAGDAVSITGIAVMLPTLLLNTGYSREFETEADTYAFKRLKEIGSSPKYFAEILQRLEAAHAAEEQTANKDQHDKSGHSIAFDYLSTHPATAERIQRALAAQ